MAKKESVRNPTVSIKARAIDEGYYQNRIIRNGEVFLFEGDFAVDSDGDYCLAKWMEAVDEAELVKLAKAAKTVKIETPKKGKTAADVMVGAELV